MAEQPMMRAPAAWEWNEEKHKATQELMCRRWKARLESRPDDDENYSAKSPKHSETSSPAVSKKNN